MNLLELVYEVRQRGDDEGGSTGTPSAGYSYYWEESDSVTLWKNAEIVRWLNRAHQEIALRTHCYRDGTTSAICEIAVSSGTSRYDIDSRILTIEDVFLVSSEASLTKWTLKDFRAEAGSYTATGTPTHYFEENQPFRITLYPIPDDDETLYLTVYRYPLADMEWTSRTTTLSEPHEIMREALIQGALMYAYQKRDADTADAGRQQFHAREFDKLVGKSVDYRTLESRRYNANLDITVRPKGYVPRVKGTTRWYENEDE